MNVLRFLEVMAACEHEDEVVGELEAVPGSFGLIGLHVCPWRPDRVDGSVPFRGLARFPLRCTHTPIIPAVLVLNRDVDPACRGVTLVLLTDFPGR